jgi:arginase family enzyme
VFRERNVVAADIVELAPGLGPIACGVVAARLAYKMIGYRFMAG